MKKLLLLCLSFFFSVTVIATHINGGYITYRYLGSNNYEITLVVYRDCYSGVPPFDNPASIGFFDANNSLLQHLLVPVDPDSILLFTPGDCIPTNICFEKATYEIVVNLSPTAFPVTIAYQRCCRAMLIQNIVNPLNVGMTFLATIGTTDNSSPVFNGEIPGFTYTGDNFVYDASASDPDGDSLVYSLTDFYDGASLIDPMPQPPFTPPYANLVWQTPYSLSNVIGGTVPLAIDPNSGIMTAVPGIAGVFQVAEKVDEYRNGVFINSSRREFQLFINPANYFNFSGYASVNNATQALDIGKAWLIRKNLYDSTLTATDTNIVSSGGYSFANTINGIYLVKASADSTSPFYPNNIPTYFGDVLFWHQATELHLCSNDTQNININLVQGINPGGPGFVGGLISQGANRVMSPGDPESRITVILFDTINQPVAYAITDDNGYFSISNLALGTYKVYIDKLNALIDNSIAPAVTLSSANPVLNNLAFTLFSDHLELSGFVNIETNYSPISFLTLIPNPAKEKVTLVFNLTTQTDLQVDVFDLFGRKAKSFSLINPVRGNHSIEIFNNKDQLTTGIYFVAVRAESYTKNLKLIIAE